MELNRTHLAFVDNGIQSSTMTPWKGSHVFALAFQETGDSLKSLIFGHNHVFTLRVKIVCSIAAKRNPATPHQMMSSMDRETVLLRNGYEASGPLAGMVPWKEGS